MSNVKEFIDIRLPAFHRNNPSKGQINIVSENTHVETHNSKLNIVSTQQLSLVSNSQNFAEQKPHGPYNDGQSPKGAKVILSRQPLLDGGGGFVEYSCIPIKDHSLNFVESQSTFSRRAGGVNDVPNHHSSSSTSLLAVAA